MNDVKLSNADFANKQNAAASSAPPGPVKAIQDGNNASADELSRQQAAEVREQSIEKSQAEQQQDVREAVTKLNDYVQKVQRDLQFNLDDNSGKTIITVVDRKTSEVVRQIPDDVALRLAQELQQDEPLSLFNAKV